MHHHSAMHAIHFSHDTIEQIDDNADLIEEIGDKQIVVVGKVAFWSAYIFVLLFVLGSASIFITLLCTVGSKTCLVFNNHNTTLDNRERTEFMNKTESVAIWNPMEPYTT